MIVSEGTPLGDTAVESILDKIGIKGDTVNAIVSTVQQVRSALKQPKTTTTTVVTAPQLAPLAAGMPPWLPYVLAGGGVLVLGTVLYFVLRK